MNDKCPICGRDLNNSQKLCDYHSQAMENLRVGYKQWNRAMNIEWNNYLKRLLDLEETGQWIREVIQYLNREDEPLADPAHSP